METVCWTPKLELGIPEIDAQHKRIVLLANQMREAVKKHDRAAVAAVIEGTVDYTLSHLKYEEELMREAGYGLLQAHAWVHEQFTQKILAFQEGSKAGEDVAEELYAVLTGWLISHIGREDRGYVNAVLNWFARLDAADKKEGHGFWHRLHHSTLATLFPHHPRR